MLVSKGQLESLLELQRNYVPCDGNHEWVDDEENEGEQYCAKCMVVKESKQTVSDEKIQAFLDELTQLSIKHGLAVKRYWRGLGDGAR